MMLSDRRTELSTPDSGCFRFCGTENTKSLPITPPIFRFTKRPLMAVWIGSAQPTVSESNDGGIGGPPSSRRIMPLPLLYSLSARLHGVLTARLWSLLGPAAFFTRPVPTSAGLHFAGAVGSLSRSLNAHLGKFLGFVTRPSDPIAYCSTTVARLVASVSSTWKPNLRPVGMGFVLEPLPGTVVDPRWTL